MTRDKIEYIASLQYEAEKDWWVGVIHNARCSTHRPLVQAYRGSIITF